MEKISCGSEVLNALLEGGLEQDVITTIYGPSSSGKTCFCLQAALSVAKEKKVLYIDTEGGFSPERAMQLSNNDKKPWEKVIVFSPTSFEEQHKLIEKVCGMANNKVGLVILDSIAMLYRLEMHKNEDIHSVNRQLALQLGMLAELTRKHHIPVLLTNQVYSHFEDSRVRMVGGDLLKYSSKCLIELQKDSKRRALLHKHRSLPTKAIEFEIKKDGIFTS